MLDPDGHSGITLYSGYIRSTRGWSYGESIDDPRTGEIIKGQVSLRLLRATGQDFLIAEGLLQPYEDGKPVSDAMMKTGDSPPAPTGRAP